MEESNPLNLLSMNMCSPMVIYVVFALVIGCGIYMTRTSLNKYNNNKMNNLSNYHSLQEVKLLVVLGATIYGLCQYNQVNLAWIFLVFPIIYLMLRNILLTCGIKINIKISYYLVGSNLPQEFQALMVMVLLRW